MSLRHLAAGVTGHGLDLGPGHMPFPVPDEATVRTVDRWTPEQHLALFPELAGNKIAQPDFLTDFDANGLFPFADGSEDFIICSHVIEHLADPLGMLCEIRRVLRPGGTAVLVVPDRRETFDQYRAGTTVEHCMVDHAAELETVDDAHIWTYVEYVGPYFAETPLATFFDAPADPVEQAAWLDWHRQRSVHVHCWTPEEFHDLIDYCGFWSTVESHESEMEFGFVLT